MNIARTAFTGVFFAWMLLTACGGSSDEPRANEAAENEKEAEQAPPLPEDVQAGLAAVESVGKPETAFDGDAGATILSETGELVSPVRSELSAKFPGRVGKVFVDEGARVTKGRPLLELETDYLRIELDRARAALARTVSAVEEAQRDFDRKKDLIQKQSVSQALYDRTKATLDQAEAARDEAEAAVALVEQRLSDAVLVSPIDGIVAERRTDVGERLGESTVAFVVVQVAPLKCRFRLPERYLARVRRGQPVRVRVDPYPDEIFEGEVKIVVQAVDSATRTFVVEAEIPNRDERLKPGLFARVELELTDEHAS